MYAEHTHIVFINGTSELRRKPKIMNLSNKHKRNKSGEWIKHPRTFLKKLTEKRLRKDPIITEEENAICKSKKKKVKAKIERNCPFCYDDIHFQYKNEEYKLFGQCKKCGAKKLLGKRCSHCKSDNIWEKDGIYICKYCAKSVQL